jgi:hypothetical protein
MVNNSKEEIQQLLEPYQPGKAVLEATSNWGLIYEWLEEILHDVGLAHPLKVGSQGLKVIMWGLCLDLQEDDLNHRK